MLNKEEQKLIEQKRQAFFDKRISFQFYYLLYQFGFLDLIESKKQKDSLLSGHIKTLPYNVHHIRPLGLGGDNNFLNLSLIDEKLHKFIHKYCIPPQVLKMMDSKGVSQKEKMINSFVPNLAPVARTEDFFKEVIVYAIRSNIYRTPIKKLAKQKKRPLLVENVRDAFSEEIMDAYNFSPQAFYRLQDMHLRFRLTPEKNRTRDMENKIAEAERKFIGRTAEKESFISEMREKWMRMNTVENLVNCLMPLFFIRLGFLPKNVITKQEPKKTVVTVKRTNQTTAINKAKKRGGKGIVDE